MATKKTDVTATKVPASGAPEHVTAAAKKTAAKTAVKPSPAKAAASPAKTVVKPVAKAPVKKSGAVEPVVKKQKSKVKVVRDSFTMPQDEYQKIAEIKETCLEAGLSVKKSEVLRAGLKALAGMSAVQLKRALAGLEKIKTGRPKKH